MQVGTCSLQIVVHMPCCCFAQRKCDQYWPSEGETVYGLMSVKLLSESVTAHYTLRKFMLKHSTNKLSVRRVSAHIQRQQAVCQAGECTHTAPTSCLSGG